jgi:hypothetical protein
MPNSNNLWPIWLPAISPAQGPLPRHFGLASIA